MHEDTYTCIYAERGLATLNTMIGATPPTNSRNQMSETMLHSNENACFNQQTNMIEFTHF